MKQLQVWMAVILIGVVGIAFAKNSIAKAAVSGGVRAMTGLNLHMRSMDVGLLKNAIGIRGLVLQNPSGFPDRTMIDLPEVYVSYDLGAFLNHRVHLSEVRVNLSEFAVIRDRQGRLNLDALKVVQQSKGQPAAAPRRGEPAPEVAIDLLRLKIGKVVYKDYSRGSAPLVQEFPLNLDERYEHITNPQAFAALIVSRALMNTTVARLTNLDLHAIQGQLGTQLRQATGMVSEAVDSAKALPGTAKATAQNAADTATETVKQTAESLKKVLPFGN